MMKHCAAMLAVLLSLAPLASSMPAKILHGTYRSSESDTVIKIEKGGYTLRGDQIEIRLDGNRTVCYTVFSWTSFGNTHELFCFSDFEK
ncbi:MAG: hypothetical protein K2I95_02865 [Treponemataceae bacterium]|nr:hypothetical protein [Treponemataceae bacterium]